MTRRNAIIISVLLLAAAAGVIFLYARSRAPESPVNTVDIRIPLTYTQPLVIAMFDLDFSIRPLEARAAPMNTEAENRFRYIDAYPNTDVVQTKFTNKLKEDIILKSPGHPERFSYALDDTGLEARFDSEGNLHLYPLGADMSQTKFRIPAPYLIDANGEKSASRDVAMTFKNGILTLVPNPQWLSSHPYPITLDPTVEITVLNVNSVPTVGGPWEVRFTTIGTDTLVITGDPDNTVYGVNVEPESLRCGNEDRSYMMDRSYRADRSDTTYRSYVFEDWSCDTEAVWRVRVLKPGHHHQIFTFGDQTAEANNDTVSNDWCGGLNTFSYRRKVVLNNSGQASALTDFPASVQLTQTGDLNNIDYSKTQNSGEDIRFCDQDNATRLEYEIENWNESATSTLWVKIPNLTAASSTEHIWMYYGNTSTTTAATTTGVWDSSFKGVWHLSEGDSTAADFYKDSTSYSNDGQLTDSDGDTTAVTGGTDGALNFNGDADYVNVPFNSAYAVGYPFTLSAIIKGDSFTNCHSITQDGTNNGPPDDTQIGWAVEICDGKIDYSNNNSPAQSINTIGTGKLYYIAVSNASATSRLFYAADFTDGSVDINETNTTNVAVTANDDEPLRIGSFEAGGGQSIVDLFDGIIDEVRVSSTNRSASWIAFEYCNMNFTCQTYGAEEGYPRPANVPGVKFR